MKMLLRVIHSVFFYSLTLVSLAIAISIASYVALFSRSKTQTLQTTAHIWARFVMAFSGIKVSVSGLENIPRDRGVLFATNHQSYADTLLVLICIPINFRIVIAKEYFKLPVFGWGWKKAGYISIVRESPLTLYRTFEKMVEVLGAGESVLISPEGTRSRDGKLGEFKHSSLFPALKSGAPIIPIAISGSYNILPRGSWIIHPHPVKFTFGKAIYIKSENEYDKKLEEVREAIAKML